MPQYLIASYLPDDFDPSTMTEEAVEAIHALNREIVAAGAERFACGLAPASSTKTLRRQPSGKVSVTDGPYIETKEHVGGIMILEAANLEQALAWARRGLVVGGAAVEVREVLFFPDPKAATEI
ncbi:MAG TPA: YciI family protein [Gemmatimonadales bacterium]|nr:YciI family protein [Gemmatimonadales bacterium]